MHPDWNTLQIRVHGDPSRPTLIYLPGIHGDWTLVTSFRAAIRDHVRFVEFTYPRTLTWSLADYATAVTAALATQGIDRGWLLGESFGSQVVWALLGRESPSAAASFHAEGVVLAGGFVRHPTIWMVRVAYRLNARLSPRLLKWLLRIYAGYARFRHRHAPETLAGVQEFVRRRSEPPDRRAIRHRLGLILENDLRPIARRFERPVHTLAGFVDPIVPYPGVRHWLRRHCPGYRGGKIFFRADHNVLGTAPRQAARQVIQWLDQSRESPRKH